MGSNLSHHEPIELILTMLSPGMRRGVVDHTITIRFPAALTPIGVLLDMTVEASEQC
jgi:hypothetical protein